MNGTYSEAALKDLEIQSHVLRNANDQQQHQLQSLLVEHGKLIESHRKLLVDIATRPAKAKQTGKTSSASKPLVVALIDGDQYIFHDNFLRRSGGGGAEAAALLYNAVVQRLGKLSLTEDSCRIVLRIYFSNQSLHKRLLSWGKEPPTFHNIAFFAGLFTQSRPNCEFVNAGDDANSTQRKVEEAFEFYMCQTECRHLFFAGCVDDTYYPMLNAFGGVGGVPRNQLITLVRPGSTYPGALHRLKLPSDEFKAVFNTDLVDRRGTPASRNVPASPSHPPTGPATGNSCRFFAMGRCDYGDRCKFRHDANTDPQRFAPVPGGDDRAPTNSLNSRPRTLGNDAWHDRNAVYGRKAWNGSGHPSWDGTGDAAWGDVSDQWGNTGDGTWNGTGASSWRGEAEATSQDIQGPGVPLRNGSVG